MALATAAATAPAWLPAAASIGGSLIGGLLGKSGQTSANRANERIAKDNRAFQERMSSTARQREVKDLRKAGLNPILAAGGGGASTPSGSTAVMKNTNEQLANSARTLIPDMMQVINTQANTALTVQQQSKTVAETNLIDEKSWLTTEQAQKISNEIKMQVPKIMEADFQTAIYQFAEKRMGIIPTGFTPTALFNFVTDNIKEFAKFYLNRKKGGKTTLRSSTTIRSKGRTSTSSQETTRND